MIPYPLNFRLHSDEALEAIARKIIARYDPFLLYKPTVIPIEDIMEKVYGLIIEFLYIRKNGSVLGKTVFEDTEIPIYEHRNGEGYKLIPVKAGTVIIDASLLHKSRVGRLRFTLAHELAHWIIDKNNDADAVETAGLFFNTMNTEFACELFDYEALHPEVRNNKLRSDKADIAKVVRYQESGDITERQANRLASRILMPKCTLKPAFHNIHNSSRNVIAVLAGVYGVSRQAMNIRLQELALIN